MSEAFDANLPGHLVSRLIHDLMGPATGLVSGLSLMRDPSAGAPREEALALVEASAETLLGLLNFYRAAYGAGDGAMGAAELESLVAALFTGGRARLEWLVVDALPGPAARALLGLSQIAAGALAAGGVATVTVERTGDGAGIKILARGVRVGLAEETARGLAGLAFAEGRAGRWAPAFHLARRIEMAGGRLGVHATPAGPDGDGALSLQAVFPT